MKRRDLLAFALLIMIGVVFPSVHAAPTLTVFPSSVATNPNNAASYIINLNGGTANASYALTVTGLPTGAIYSFSSTSIGPSGSSVLTIQTTIGSPLYCPTSYPFTVTATNTLLSSDSASATGTLGVNHVGPDLVVSLSTDKSTYMVGETIAISIVTNRPAEGTLTISPPSGSAHSYQYGYTSPPMKSLTATPPMGTWAVTFAADDYCGVSSNAVVHFDVAALTISSTNTTTTTVAVTSTPSSTKTITTTVPVTSTSSSLSMTSTVTSTTSTVISTSVTTETGVVTMISNLMTTATAQRTNSIVTTIQQGTMISVVVISNVQNLPLELLLGTVLTISLLAIAINLIRRPRYGSAITCGKCGFKNPFTASSFCVKCGQPLERVHSV